MQAFSSMESGRGQCSIVMRLEVAVPATSGVTRRVSEGGRRPPASQPPHVTFQTSGVHVTSILLLSEEDIKQILGAADLSQGSPGLRGVPRYVGRRPCGGRPGVSGGESAGQSATRAASAATHRRGADTVGEHFPCRRVKKVFVRHGDSIQGCLAGSTDSSSGGPLPERDDLRTPL
jgi:hypothetical protein